MKQGKPLQISEAEFRKAVAGYSEENDRIKELIIWRFRTGRPTKVDMFHMRTFRSKTRKKMGKAAIFKCQNQRQVMAQLMTGDYPATHYGLAEKFNRFKVVEIKNF